MYIERNPECVSERDGAKSQIRYNFTFGGEIVLGGSRYPVGTSLGFRPPLEVTGTSFVSKLETNVALSPAPASGTYCAIGQIIIDSIHDFAVSASVVLIILTMIAHQNL